MGRLIHREDREEYVVLRREARPVTRILVAGLLLVGLIGGAITASQNWYRGQIDPPGRAAGKVEVEVAEGTGVGSIATQLADEGVVSDANVFRFWLRDKDVEVQAGAYTFLRSSSFDEALTTLVGGPEERPTTPVTVPEGLTLAEIRAEVAKAMPRMTPEQVESALTDPAIRSKYQPAEQFSLEGLVFPDTYEVDEEEDAASLVRRMVAEADRVADDLDITAGAARRQLTPYQVLVVASLIQEEAGSVEEMPKIARVVYNRLAAEMPLGIDATSRYLSAQTGAPVDFASSSPFNTRRNVGLPPTPIAASGEPALRAALSPADGPWTYYVLEAPGRHFFTDSVAAFNQKRQECAAKGLGCGP